MGFEWKDGAKQAWIDAWERSLLTRFWRTLWLRKMLLAGVGLFSFGMLACVVQWAFNGHRKSGTLYEITGAIAIAGDVLMMLSVCVFCIYEVGGDIIRLIRKFRKRP